MTATEAAVAVPETLPPETNRRKATAPDDRSKPKRQPNYSVVLHNDDLNGFGFVIEVLQKVLKFTRWKATLLTLQAHTQGKAVVWSGPLEVAELKADQIRSCGPDPQMRERGAQTLRVTVEPLPE